MIPIEYYYEVWQQQVNRVAEKGNLINVSLTKHTQG